MLSSMLQLKITVDSLSFLSFQPLHLLLFAHLLHLDLVLDKFRLHGCPCQLTLLPDLGLGLSRLDAGCLSLGGQLVLSSLGIDQLLGRLGLESLPVSRRTVTELESLLRVYRAQLLLV